MTDRPPNEPPSNAEFGLLRAYLAQNGYSQAQIKDAIGNKPNGKTRQQITQDLIVWMEGEL